jgi:hypothetical protein
LENGYFMVDLPALLKAKRKHDAVNRLSDVHMILSTNNRSLEEADSKAFMRGLTKELGVKEEQKFSREKFDELRRFTEMNG